MTAVDYDAVRAQALRLPALALRRDVAESPSRFVDKAGIVPFRRDAAGTIQFYLLKPQPSGEVGTPPQWQICKGTRMAQQGGVWRDVGERPMDAELVETLLQTALREGVEEIGLKPENILSLSHWGVAEYASQKKPGTHKTMWLTFAEVKDSDDFGLPDAAHSKTAQRAWVTLDDQAQPITASHANILREALPALQHVRGIANNSQGHIK